MNVVGIRTRQKRWSVAVLFVLGALLSFERDTCPFHSCLKFGMPTATAAVRNEHCTWPRIGLYPKEFESSFIEFKVYARPPQLQMPCLEWC